MRTPGGENASHIGIFVKIKINALSRKQASSSGVCSYQDSNVPLRWSSLKFLESESSCNLDRRGEDIKEHKDSQATGATSLFNSVAEKKSADLVHKQSRILHQETAVQCTAEIHANAFIEGTIV